MLLKQEMEKYKKQYKYDKTEKGKERTKKYQQSEKGKKFYTIRNWKSRGIICDDYDKVYDEYINTTECQLCNNTFKDSTERCLDHCHESGKIRNILCRACNTRDYRPVYDRNKSRKKIRHYENTWGGDPRCNNNLLKIHVNLFL